MVHQKGVSLGILSRNIIGQVGIRFLVDYQYPKKKELFSLEEIHSARIRSNTLS